MARYFMFFIIAHSLLFASDVVDYADVSNNKNITFFLSTTKSGTNLITGCLSAITRKPISWFYWGRDVLDPDSNYRRHISYNRLGLPMVSDFPLLYRTHYQFAELMAVPSQENRLIFVTRNPKELLYRKFYLLEERGENPDPEFMKEFLDKYLMAFHVYESWCPSTRMIVFYEDFIGCEEEYLLQMLDFMNEAPLFWDDFLANKQAYMSRLLESYTNQHVHNSGGVSSRDGPRLIYYTANACGKTLEAIDEYIETSASEIWRRYLKRFQTTSVK